MVRVVGVEQPIVGESPWRDLVTTAWIGVVHGGVLWALTYLLSHYVINNITCRMGTSLVACGSTEILSAGIAMVVATTVGLVLLVRQRIYRPLFVALAACVATWGINGSWLAGVSWWTLIFTLLISAAVYAVMGWLVRVRLFWLAFTIVALVILILRLLAMNT